MKGFTVSRFLIRTPDIGYDFETNSGRAFSYFSYGVACSEVEIDCLTGSHKVCTKYSYIYLSSNSWIKCLKRFKELWLILSPLSIWLRCLTPHFFFHFFNFSILLVNSDLRYFHDVFVLQNLSTTIVMDVGNSLNPAIDIGQVRYSSIIHT